MARHEIENGINQWEVADGTQTIYSDTWTGKIILSCDGTEYAVDTSDQLMMDHLNDVVQQQKG